MKRKIILKLLTMRRWCSTNLFPVFILLPLIGLAAYFGARPESARTIQIPGLKSPVLLGAEATPAPTPTEPEKPKSPITGLPCDHSDHRPIAAMLAGDPITRPLSGLKEADLIIEMPVTMDQITRMMAMYQCEEPTEIGSVRSSRHDFLPLAAGFDAIYGHWGGSHFALDELKSGALNNIDALINPASAFFRKSGIVAPHNGFTSYERLRRAAEALRYPLTASSAQVYPHTDDPKLIESLGTPAEIISVPYNGLDFAIRWTYNAETKTYARARGGRPEMDRLSNTQIEIGVVIVMKTRQRHLEAQYTDMTVIGKGKAIVYQYGRAIPASWEKKDVKAKLRFINDAGEDIPFVPGKIWIQLVAS